LIPSKYLEHLQQEQNIISQYPIMTKRPMKGPNGYNIGGKTFKKLIGSRREVWGEKTAYKTSGGLTKSDLTYNPSTRRIISKSKHISATRVNHLKNAGYFTQKGKFGFVKKSVKKMSRRHTMGGKSRKHKKGGNCGAKMSGGDPDLNADLDTNEVNPEESVE
jgi:hypothetical protein